MVVYSQQNILKYNPFDGANPFEIYCLGVFLEFPNMDFTQAHRLRAAIYPRTAKLSVAALAVLAVLEALLTLLFALQPPLLLVLLVLTTLKTKKKDV